MDYDPMMKRNINVTRMITEALQPLHQTLNELKRQKQQLPITMFFHKVEKRKVATNEDPQPSTSSALTSSTHLRFHLLSLLQFPMMMMMMILMTLLLFHQ